MYEDGRRRAACMVDGEAERFDLTLATLQPPALTRLLPDALAGRLLDAYPQRFLGVVCLILKLRRSLLPYYSVNICDPTPMTTVVETSHVVGTEHTDGLTLAYLPKYCDASSETFQADDATIYERFTTMLRKMVPDFTDADVVDWTVQRAPLVEPVHARGHSPRTAPVWPGVEGLGLASASQVYPGCSTATRSSGSPSRSRTRRPRAWRCPGRPRPLSWPPPPEPCTRSRAHRSSSAARASAARRGRGSGSASTSGARSSCSGVTSLLTDISSEMVAAILPIYIVFALG